MINVLGIEKIQSSVKNKTWELFESVLHITHMHTLIHSFEHGSNRGAAQISSLRIYCTRINTHNIMHYVSVSKIEKTP